MCESCHEQQHLLTLPPPLRLLLPLLRLLQMFGPDMPPLEWDADGEYSRQRVQLYYLSNAGQPLKQVREENRQAGICYY
jgi:hypothetical protein